MPNWNEVLEEIREESISKPHLNALDRVRRKYLNKIAEITKRNTIAYYSGWLQKQNALDAAINDKDKSGFMLAIHKLDRKAGLDLILHTPGGDIAATESLVDYLYSMFGKDVRVIVPQISMSAGTMIALSSKEIMMGKHSNLGPIDPQMGGLPCQAVLDEFEQAKEEVKNAPHSAALWQVIISKYHPTFLGSCRQAIEWSKLIVTDWLNRNMLEGKEANTTEIVEIFSDHSKNKSHARHIGIDECKKAGLNITNIEDHDELQDAILTTHHAFMHTFLNTNCVKIIENHKGVAYIEQVTLQSHY